MPPNRIRHGLKLTAALTCACLTAAHGQAHRSQPDPALKPPPPLSMPATTLRPQTAAERKAFAPGDKSTAAVVNGFNQMGFFDHDPVGAMKKYLADDFIEHYPDLAKDGPGSDKELTIRFFETRGWKQGEQMQDIIYKVMIDGEFAAVFHKTQRSPDDLGTAYVDIFRIANGLIREHWAVGQPVSPKISARHNMF